MLVPKTEIIASKEGVELARFVVEPGEYVIGRESACDLPVDDGVISHQHARFTVNFDEVLIEDLGSVNGTFINGKPVTECTRLWPNQKVLLGSVVVETRRVKAPGDSTQSLSPQTAAVHRLLPAEFLREKKYEIGGVVAHGAMGAILDAREVATQRTVAMKVMLSNLSETDLLRFIEEAQITSQLEHPNIVPLHELGVDENDQVYYTMKLVKGITLKKVLELLAQGVPETVAKYPPRRLLIILMRVCDAVAFAHSKGVLHRDLKPDNVMIGDFGEVLLMDWGLAKIINREEAQSGDDVPKSVILSIRHGTEEAGATMVGSVIGTPHYMSPEQAGGEVELLDQRTDIYALGAMLYHILALQPPIAGTNVMEILEKVRLGKITPLQELNAAAHGHGGVTKRLRHKHGRPIPESLAAVAMRALSLDREDRYETATAFKDEIDAYLGGFATAAEQAGLLKQLMLLIARHKTVTIILAACATVFLLSGPLVFIRVNNERKVALKERAIAETERAHAEAERQRAQNALTELRKAAPAYHSEAHLLADAQKFPEALAKNDLAISLNPDNPDYELFRAHTLEAMQRLPEAIKSYQRVLALRTGDASAKANIALCEKLMQQSAGKMPLRVTLLNELLDAVIAEKRYADSVYLASALGRETEVLGALFHTQLKAIVSQEGWKDSRLQRLPDRTFSLDLSDLSVPDLSPLHELPVSILNLARCGAGDLRPLAQMPLHELDVSETGVIDLSPLAGMPLRRLSIKSTRVTDLSPLAGMPLDRLDLSYTPVKDLKGLQGLPLSSLAIEGTRIADFSPLQGMALKSLNVRNTLFNDLSLIKGKPLQTLDLSNTTVRDISALGGLPLVSLRLSGCQQLTDLSPLASCGELKNLLIPAQIVDVAFLRKLPKLERLSNADFEVFDRQWAKVTVASDFFAQQGDSLARLTEFKAKVNSLRSALLKLGLNEADLAQRLQVDQISRVVDLDLSQLQISEIDFVKGLPLRRLKIEDSAVTDLSPLRGSSLVELNGRHMAATDLSPLADCPFLRILKVADTKISDLRPLAGKKLQTLEITRTDIADLTLLRGMTTLQELRLTATKVRDLTPLRGLPLQEITLPGISDIGPLFGMTTLERVRLDSMQTNIEPLRKLTNLKFLSYKWNSDKDRPAQTAAEFWAEYDRDAKMSRELARQSGSQLPGRKAMVDEARLRLALKPLTAQAKWTEDRVKPMGDGTFFLNLSNLNVTDLSFLRGLPISRLWLAKCGATDLTPLTGLPLVELNCEGLAVSDWSPIVHMGSLQDLNVQGTGFADLTVLRGKRLTRLNLRTKSVTDISPLRGMPIESLNLSLTKLTDLSALRSMPLRELSLGKASITDYSQITACRNLESLDLTENTNVTDLKFVKGLKLRELAIGLTLVKDISVVAGMPLQKIWLDGSAVSDVSPLAQCPTLEQICLPSGAKNLESLRKLPNLKRISLNPINPKAETWIPSQTAEEFWAEFDEKKQ